MNRFIVPLLALGLLSSCLVDQDNQPVEGFETRVSAIVTGSKDERRLVPDTARVDKSTVAIVDSSNSTICTGTTVGSSFILTAAHCIFDIKSKQFKSGLTIVPALHQTLNYKPYSRFHIKRAFLLKAFREDLGYNGYTEFAASKDIAILQLREFNENTVFLSDISKAIAIGYGDEIDLKKEKFEVISYTAEQGKEKNSQYYQHGGCEARGKRNHSTAFYHNCDTGPSSSGMALVKRTSQGFKAVAIHTGGAGQENSGAYFPVSHKRDMERILSYQFEDLEFFEMTDLRSEPFYGFDVINQCQGPIDVAIYYDDIDGKTRIHGLVTIESGELYMAQLKARNRAIKVYAKSRDGQSSWVGDEYINVGNQTLPFFPYEIKGTYEDGLLKFKCK